VLGAVAGLAAVLLLAIAIEVRSDELGPEDVAATLAATQRYIAAANEHDVATLHELTRPDLVVHESASGATQGRAGFLEWARLIGEAYPSFAITVDPSRPTASAPPCATSPTLPTDHEVRPRSSFASRTAASPRSGRTTASSVCTRTLRRPEAPPRSRGRARLSRGTITGCGEGS
jgi:hypothetical protein